MCPINTYLTPFIRLTHHQNKMLYNILFSTFFFILRFSRQSDIALYTYLCPNTDFMKFFFHCNLFKPAVLYNKGYEKVSTCIIKAPRRRYLSKACESLR